MAGLVPAIPVFLFGHGGKTWMRGTRPGMTTHFLLWIECVLLLDHAQIGAHRQRIVVTELEVGHVRVARRNAPFERAREFVEINTAAKHTKWRRPFMSAPASGAHCMTARAEFRHQPLPLADRILCLRRAANSKKSDRREHRRQDFHRAIQSEGVVRQSE